MRQTRQSALRSQYSPRSDAITLEELWRELKFVPNAAQRDAIHHVEGPLYLPAGPGSGKTRVLLWRTLNLIVFHDVAPEQIYLSTFTEKAALQLREGLRSLLSIATSRTGKPYDIAKMYVGTVHSLCQRMLVDRRFYPGKERGRAPVLLDDLDQYLHLARTSLWKELTAAAGFSEQPEREINAFFSEGAYDGLSKHKAVAGCIGLFNRLSEECVDPLVAASATEDPVLRKLLSMYNGYRASLAPQGSAPRTDFSLLQQHALRLLDAHTESGTVFRHVVIDEYQDTNAVQERIFFRLAARHKNLCVVGDDDQALYRFRGATVENFVEFPTRCEARLGRAPTKIPLVTNYRSRARIVRFYGDFMEQRDWSKERPARGHYRVTDKKIVAHRQDVGPSVVTCTPSKPDAACAEIASLVRRLVDEGRVTDPNQIAFLYPSLKSKHVERMIDALEQQGLSVYAPRAKGFLAAPEVTDMLGLFLRILGRPERGEFHGADYDAFHAWLDSAEDQAEHLIAEDARLGRFAADRRTEVETAASDYAALVEFAARKGWDLKAPYDIPSMKRALAEAPRVSERARKSIKSPYFESVALKRQQEGRPFLLEYILKRATSIDWSLLDLFYRCSGFPHFIQMFDAAQREQNPDEGPVCNLGLLSQFIARFMDQRAPIITGQLLQQHKFERLFVGSYLYALFRRGESEYEDAEDPFPKGRIPFLTIHQAKGLEFPVVVLGNLRKDDRGAQLVEKVVRPFLTEDRHGEPLDRIGEFDIMRMFYVALSRAQNLLVLSHFKGQGQRINEPFARLIDAGVPRVTTLRSGDVPPAESPGSAAPKTYSYTGDYLNYRRCPRQYMIFRKFGFVPSRSQTMIFGTLVHRTLDDLHQYLIAGRAGA